MSLTKLINEFFTPFEKLIMLVQLSKNERTYSANNLASFNAPNNSKFHPNLSTGAFVEVFVFPLIEYEVVASSSTWIKFLKSTHIELTLLILFGWFIPNGVDSFWFHTQST